MNEIHLTWFARCILTRIIAWGMSDCRDLSRLREEFDKNYDHRSEEWRRHVWSLAAERHESKVQR